VRPKTGELEALRDCNWMADHVLDAGESSDLVHGIFWDRFKPLA
jgi:hypothetical protein